VYYQKQLLDLAVRAFEQSIESEPTNPMFHYHLGLAHVRNGDLVRGRRALQAALKLKPDYAEAQRALSSIAG
jgi:Flp pilus assembly protein TadD